MVRKFFTTFLVPLLITLALWFLTDAIITSILGMRGESSFFTADRTVGQVNKPNFSGKFGGFLDSFSTIVSIGPFGERKSSEGNCKGLPFFLFVGDSTTAGFEVNDDETFVSKINRNCETTHIVGANFGVRGYDTHEVIANYARISRSIKHDAVFYLIADNDLLENMERFPYLNIAKRFGRAFHGKYYLAAISNFEHAYLNFRIFMGDHFYITSTAIKFFERWRVARSGPGYTVIPANQAETLIKLVKILSAAVKSNGAKLYIAACPCLASYPCAGPDIEILLQNSSDQSKDFVVLPLATELESKFYKREIKKKDMRFYNDLHLSKYGHNVLAKELPRLIGEVDNSSQVSFDP
jgi:lysophospholipase L1-like esterase